MHCTTYWATRCYKSENVINFVFRLYRDSYIRNFSSHTGTEYLYEVMQGSPCYALFRLRCEKFQDVILSKKSVVSTSAALLTIASVQACCTVLYCTVATIIKPSPALPPTFGKHCCIVTVLRRPF